MTLRTLLVHEADVVRRTATTADRYGNPTYTWATDATYDARLEQLSAEERAATEDRGFADFRLFLPASADITQRDRVTVEGTTYEVVGEPVRALARRSTHHVEALLRVVS